MVSEYETEKKIGSGPYGDTGLTAADAWAVADDRSTWRALRPTAGYVQH